ncbi:MAG TPA: histidine kinase dimerization/phosphoacceptor domain -containing protein [Polyangiaceae bacterium]|nr:histidine kinase dimerization/phosphoacceptor domain -containing protein [Polyangiaceae bacterium]
MTPEELPDAIVRLAVRLRDVVLLEDATGSPDFSSDPYIRRTRPRSVLCLPLLKQNALMGVLYLENQLTPHAFTPSRVGVLRLLASQAAISLENARLYGDLQSAVTRARASLDEKEALLKEVHHRVKNNLQLVSSLLNLQASRITEQAAKEMFEESRNGVRSIASVHENLYRTGNFAKVPMAAHVESLCSQLARTHRPHERGITFERRVHDVHLEVGRAVACGLIINELVSNALRHAFPPGRSGTVRVELDPVGDGRHALRLSDDGIGLPAGVDFGSADSLGLQLVHDLARQLGATVEVSRDAGTTFTVTFDEAERGRVRG